MQNLKVFCCACTRYAWILPDFIKLAQANLPLPIDIHIGDERWDIRMRSILESYTCRDVIYLQEDFLITKVDMPAIEEIYKFHCQKNAAITKLGVNKEFYTTTIDSIGWYQLRIQKAGDPYLMSHQPVAIFNREFLLSTISDRTPDASTHELLTSKMMNSRVYCVGEPYLGKNRSDIFTFEHAIRKGKVLRDAEPYLTNVPENVEWDG